MKGAMRALTRYAVAGIEETGLGLLGFGVLEVLLHSASLPRWITDSPIVDLISGFDHHCVDRLFCEGLGQPGRERRRPAEVRIVALTLTWQSPSLIQHFESIPGR